MSSDLSHQIQDLLQRAIELIAGLGFILPFAAIILVNLFGKKNKQKAAQRSGPEGSRPTTTRIPTGPVQGVPAGPLTWMGMPQPVESAPPRVEQAARKRGTQWGSTFDGNDSAKIDERLQWGSAFAKNDAAKDEETLRWGSPFENDHKKTKWGFDSSEWKSSFSHEKDDEPKITVG